MPEGHAVFISYNWRDRLPVETVARALEERSLSPFLGRWYPQTFDPNDHASSVGSSGERDQLVTQLKRILSRLPPYPTTDRREKTLHHTID